MLRRQKTGSVVCSSCGTLVGVNDERCLNCGRRYPGLFGYAGALRNLGNDLGFTPIVMVVCLVLYTAALLMDPSSIGGGGLLGLLSPGLCPQFVLGASGAVPMFDFDRWWTVLTAGFLHGGLLHIGFNLMWVRQLGPVVAKAFGPGRSVVLFIVTSMAGFLLTSFVFLFVFRSGLLSVLPGALRGSPYTLGASAAIFGWLGALIVYGQRTGDRMFTRNLLWGAAVPLLVIGFVFPAVDNWAHIGGLASGYLLGRFFDPAKPDRIDHMVLALVLMAVTVVAFAVAIVHGLGLMQDPQVQNVLGCSR